MYNFNKLNEFKKLMVEIGDLKTLGHNLISWLK